MIVEAIDVITQKKMHINDAGRGRRYSCVFCGAIMHPVLEVPNPFYRCHDGCFHTHPLCRQLERGNTAYNPEEIDVDLLFRNAFRPTPEPKPRPGPQPGPDDGPDDGLDDEHDKPSSAPVIVPCRTMRHILNAGIHELDPDTKVGGKYTRSDVFLWYKDMPTLRVANSLGRRIVAARPVRPLQASNAVLFSVFSKRYKSDVYENVYFILAAPSRTEYNKLCRRLFGRVIDATGIGSNVSKYNMVWLAADWQRLDEGLYGQYSIPDRENDYGAHIGTYVSSRQVLPIPNNKE